MIREAILAVAPGGIKWLVIFIFLAILIFLFVLAVRFISKGSKQRQKLQQELGRLADELEQIRRQAEADKKDKSSAQSG